MKKLFERMFIRPNYENSIERWAQVEYGKDWEWAYQFMLKQGKPPIRGVNF